MKLWAVFFWRDGHAVPECFGVFDTAAQAEGLCRDRLWIVCPLTLNEVIQEERTNWVDSYFPNQSEPAKETP